MSTERLPGYQAHPRGLAALVTIKACDSFGYLGLRALLIIYLTDNLRVGGAAAFDIVGSFLALSYLMPVIGGLVADRATGHRMTCATGMLLTTVGYASLTWSAAMEDGTNQTISMTLGLACVAVGNGFVKSSVMTMVGRLYERHDRRREGGFLIGYMGMNIGQLLSATFASLATYRLGWPYGFATLGVGSAVGLAVLLSSVKRLPPEQGRKFKSASRALGTAVAGAAVAVCMMLLVERAALGWVLVAAWFATAFYLHHGCRTHGTPADRTRLVVAVILALFAAIGWVFVEQAAGSLDLLAVQHIPPTFLGVKVAPPQYQSLNPIFLILLCPMAAALLARMNRGSQGAAVSRNFAWGFVFFAASFATLGAAALLCPTPILSPWWLVLCYLLSAIGEAMISPIGAATMTRLSMPRLGGAVMGLWYLSFAAGDFIAQKIGALTNVDEPSTSASLETYGQVFLEIAAAAALGAIVMQRFGPLLTRLQACDEISKAHSGPVVVGR